MSERATHSKLAIASTILPLVTWIYLVVMFLLIFKCEPCVEMGNKILGNSFGALGLTVILLIIFVGLIPFCAHIIGLVFGIVGFYSKNKKRGFAIAGIILNALPLAIWITVRILTEFKN